MGAELVGPLPTVVFLGGPVRPFGQLPRLAYSPPKNTMDPRAVACTDHHVACDCREAMWTEDLAEMRAEYRALRGAAWRELAGHRIEHPVGLTEAERVVWPHLCRRTGCGFLPTWAIEPMTGYVKPYDPERAR